MADILLAFLMETVRSHPSRLLNYQTINTKQAELSEMKKRLLLE